MYHNYTGYEEKPESNNKLLPGIIIGLIMGLIIGAGFFIFIGLGDNGSFFSHLKILDILVILPAVFILVFLFIFITRTANRANLHSEVNDDETPIYEQRTAIIKMIALGLLLLGGLLGGLFFIRAGG